MHSQHFYGIKKLAKIQQYFRLLKPSVFISQNTKCISQFHSKNPHKSWTDHELMNSLTTLSSSANILCNSNKSQYTNQNISVQLNKYSCAVNKNTVGRHLYHKEVEDAINEQIVGEFNAMYQYLSMASYFGRTDIALPGCYGFFMNMHVEEHEHALIFLNFQNMRGGKVVLDKIELPPNAMCLDGIRMAFAMATKMEESIKEKLMKLNNIAEKHHDLGVIDLVSSYFVPAQDRSISEMSRLLVRITKMGTNGAAEYLFDKEIHRAFVKKVAKPYLPDMPSSDVEAGKKDLYI